MALFAAFTIGPVVQSIIYSLTNYDLIQTPDFVGLNNYIKIFTDPNHDFLNALIFTTLFTIVSIITVNIIAFSLAMLLTRKMKGTNFFRSVFFLPNLIGGIVLGFIWQIILNGILANYSMNVTSNTQNAFWGLVILTCWQQIGYMMIIYIAGLSNISTDVLEAARVDGAGYFTTLFKVTIPSVMPSITICLFLTITNAFKLFDQNLALTAGAPAGKTRMLALDIYETFYGRVGNEGLGQAKSVIFFLIVAAASLSQLILTRRKEVES